MGDLIPVPRTYRTIGSAARRATSGRKGGPRVDSHGVSWCESWLLFIAPQNGGRGFCASYCIFSSSSSHSVLPEASSPFVTLFFADHRKDCVKKLDCVLCLVRYIFLLHLIHSNLQTFWGGEIYKRFYNTFGARRRILFIIIAHRP